MTITRAVEATPTGLWKADPVHSSVGFAVRHMGVATFRGGFDEFTASLDQGVLTGAAKVASVRVQDPNLTAHLLSPEFFDAERYPEIRFESTELRAEGDQFLADGELELKGVRKPIHLHGTITPPRQDPYGNERVGITLRTTVDRTDFGVDWNAELPTGGQVVENEVELTAELELIREA
jgi:polyisoprenoid-binding protein YceI